LQEYKRPKLQAIAKEIGLKVKANVTNVKLVDLILERNEVGSEVDSEQESTSLEAVPGRVSVKTGGGVQDSNKENVAIAQNIDETVVLKKANTNSVVPERVLVECSGRAKARKYEDNISIAEDEDDCIRIEKFNIPMTNGKLKCLKPAEWLNDEVINFYFGMLQERDNLKGVKSKYFNTFFMERLRVTNNGYTYENVQRWSRKFDVFSLEKVYIPVHVGQHWTLVVVDLVKKGVHYYDSYISSDNGEAIDIMEDTLTWLQDEARDKKETILNADEYTLFPTDESVPQQENGYDCGVFTIIAAKLLSNNQSLEYSQKDMGLFRTQIEIDILEGELPETRKLREEKELSGPVAKVIIDMSNDEGEEMEAPLKTGEVEALAPLLNAMTFSDGTKAPCPLITPENNGSCSSTSSPLTGEITQKISMPLSRAEFNSRWTSGLTTKHLKKYKPVVLSRFAEWKPRRTEEAIGKVLEECGEKLQAKYCMSAFQSAKEYLFGPFEEPGDIIEACCAWSNDLQLQPSGVFSMIFCTTSPQRPTRGEQRFVRCQGYKLLNCQCWLLYEHAIDMKFYLVGANFDHHRDCLLKGAEIAAHRRARGQLALPLTFFELAKAMRRYNFSTEQIMQFLQGKARDEGVTVTWNWKKVDYHVQKALGGFKWDVRESKEWLQKRFDELGLPYSYTEDADGVLERVFYVEEEALEHWKRGTKVVFFDTTHSTNNYDLKLGLFVSMDWHGRTTLLAVTLLRHEDAKSFHWVFSKFADSIGMPDIIFTDGDAAMGRALQPFETVHLLCIYHIGLNFKHHVDRLFPPRKRSVDNGIRDKFVKRFRDLMHLPFADNLDEEGIDEEFKRRYRELLEVLDEINPCPNDLEGNTQLSQVPEYSICDEEFLAKNDADAIEALQNRISDQGKKTPIWLAWQWLKKMYRTRRKWARCFVKLLRTYGSHSTQRSECANSMVKRELGGRKKLTDLFKLISHRRNKMTSESDEVAERLKIRQDRAKDKGLGPTIIKNLQGKLNSFAIKKLLEYHYISQEMEAMELCMVVDQRDKTPERMFKVGREYNNHPFTATLTSCSGACLLNTGLPCAHILKVHVATNTHSIDLDMIDDFWKLKETTSETPLTGGTTETPLTGGTTEHVEEIDHGFDQDEQIDVQPDCVDDNWLAKSYLNTDPSERYPAVLEAVKPFADVAMYSGEAFCEVMLTLNASAESLKKMFSIGPFNPDAGTTGNAMTQIPDADTTTGNAMTQIPDADTTTGNAMMQIPDADTTTGNAMTSKKGAGKTNGGRRGNRSTKRKRNASETRTSSSSGPSIKRPRDNE
jgi:sentrin-specific protease 1